MEGDRVAVILDIDEKNATEGEEDKLKEPIKPPIYWIDGTFFNSFPFAEKYSSIQCG